MEEPQGQLPPSVYRRRRLVATVGSAVLVLVIIWAAGALLASSGSSVHGTADENPAAGVPLPTISPSNPPTIGRLSPGGATTSPVPTSPLAPSPGAPLPSATPTPTTPAPPPAPLPCPDSVIQVTALTNAPSYPVGAHPIFTLRITNVGSVACTRDVSHQFRSLVVVAAGGTTPLWSSSDCYSVVTHEVPVLQSNQPVSYSINWAGRTSAAGCPESRNSVPAGEYDVIGKLGALTGAPTPFTLTSR